MGTHVFFSCQNQMIRYCVSKVVYCAFVTWDSSVFFLSHYSVYFWHSFLAYLHTYSNYGGEFLTVYTKLKTTKTPSCFCTLSVSADTHIHTTSNLFLSFSHLLNITKVFRSHMCVCALCVLYIWNYCSFAPSNSINYYPSTSSNKAQHTCNDVASIFFIKL